MSTSSENSDSILSRSMRMLLGSESSDNSQTTVPQVSNLQTQNVTIRKSSLGNPANKEVANSASLIDQPNPAKGNESQIFITPVSTHTHTAPLIYEVPNSAGFCSNDNNHPPLCSTAVKTPARFEVLCNSFSELGLSEQTTNRGIKTQLSPTAEDNIAKILASQEREREQNASSFGYLKEKFASFEFTINQNLAASTRRINALETSFRSVLSKLNDKLDGAYSYVDERIDSFTEIFKSANLDCRFEEVYESIDTQIKDVKLTIPEPHPPSYIPDLIDSHLCTKQFDFSADSVLSQGINKAVLNQTQSIRDDFSVCQKSINS